MAGEINSMLGRDDFSFGPAYLDWDTGSGGLNLDMGETDMWKLKYELSKLDLKTSQAGDRPADRAIKSQMLMIDGGLAQANVDRLAEAVQGIEIERDSQGRPTRVWFSSLLGQRDSSRQRQLTFSEIIDGKKADPTTQPFGVLDIWKAVPNTESAELTFDATGQRYFPISFTAYIAREAQYLDHEGRPTYGALRNKVYV